MAFGNRAGTPVLNRVRMSGELRPFLAGSVAVAAQNRRQRRPDDLGLEQARRTQCLVERFAHQQAAADDRCDAKVGEPFAERDHRRRSGEPWHPDLQHLRAEFGRERDEALEARALGIGARAAALQAEMIGQTVGVQADEASRA